MIAARDDDNTAGARRGVVVNHVVVSHRATKTLVLPASRYHAGLKVASASLSRGRLACHRDAGVDQ